MLESFVISTSKLSACLFVCCYHYLLQSNILASFLFCGICADIFAVRIRNNAICYYCHFGYELVSYGEIGLPETDFNLAKETRKQNLKILKLEFKSIPG